MKKSLLTIALAGVALSSSAIVPAVFRDCAWNDIDGGGKMDYELVMDTDGSEYVRMVPSTKQLPNGTVPSGARYMRTADLGEALPAEYTIFAFEYKISRASDRLCFYFHEKYNEAEWVTPMLSVSDEWQTAYCLFTSIPTWWRDESDSSKRYHWVILDDWSYNATDFVWCVKNLRYLTVAEAEAEVGNSIKGSQSDTLTPANSDITAVADDEISATMFETKDATGAYNPILGTSPRVVPVVSTNNYFAFEYSAEEDIPFTLWFVKAGAPSTPVTNQKLAAAGELFEDFKTYSIDLQSQIEQISFAKAFGSGDYLWLQFNTAPQGTIFAVRDIRWTSEKELSGIENVAADQAAGVATYYNLQGVKVANPSNGLFIKKQGNTTTKVLVK